jgi:hypothetical protein
MQLFTVKVLQREDLLLGNGQERMPVAGAVDS